MTFWNEYEDDGLMVLGLSYQNETTLQSFIEDQGITFPVLQDVGRGVYGAYNLAGGQSPYPRDFIVDKKGIIRFADTEYDPGTMITVVESLLGNQTSDTRDPSDGLPAGFSISRVYPNPFNPAVTIEVTIPVGQPVDLDIVDISGRWVDGLYSGWLSSGVHRFRWGPSHGHAGAGRSGSGVYLAVLRGSDGASVQKLVLLK